MFFSRFVFFIFLTLAYAVNAFAATAEPMNAPPVVEKRGLSIERPVVEVAGQLLGSGTIILLNRKPVILTNSHVLQGNKVASVRLFAPQVVKLPVLMDWPIYDMAVIGLDGKDSNGHSIVTTAQKAYLKSIAADGFCNQADSVDKADCLAKTYVNFRNVPELEFEHHVRLVIAEDGLARDIDSLTPQQNAWLLKDLFISGYFGSVFVAPIYLRPGSSGGALFCNKKYFCGLITKVSASAEPVTLSIPGDNIQAVIESKNSTGFGEWVSGPHGRFLKWKNGDNILTSGTVSDTFSSAGGELTNGGGELSNGGGELANGGAPIKKKISDRYWQMTVKEGFYRAGQSRLVWTYRNREVETLNPFLETHSSLQLNGIPIAFLDIQQDPPGVADVFMSASLSIFNYYMDKTRAKQITSYHATPEAGKILALTRKDYPVPPLKFARLYSIDSPTHFTLLNNNCNTTAGDNAEALAMEYDRVEANPAFLKDEPPACAHKWEEYAVDQSGFSVAHPFRVRKISNLALNVKFRDETNKEFEVRIDKHLLSISFLSAGEVLKLIPDQTQASASVTYRDSEGKSSVTAVAIYDTENINSLDRIFIRTKGRLLEFLTCVPGLNCSR